MSAMGEADYEHLAKIHCAKWVEHAKKAWPNESIHTWEEMDELDRSTAIAAMRDLMAEILP